MKLNEFYYNLPKELIAQEPLKQRDTSRLMVVDRGSRTIEEKNFKDIYEYIEPGDCLVLNDTKVLPVRLLGERKTGGKVEIFVINPYGEKIEALVRPSKRVKDGEVIEFDNGIKATVLGKADIGRYVSFNAPVDEVMKQGHMPLPPYISREDTPGDRDDYQTVYASKGGATASPTAGLHFTQDLLKKMSEKGVSIVYVTLHTSYGTFSPVKAENIEDHVMHAEYCELSEENAKEINRVKGAGGRIISVGTTSTRVLESSSSDAGRVKMFSGETNIFIYPGYKFKIIDGIITNFHLPESTLLMLVSAFGDRDLIFEAYKRAVEHKFRFFSYGDAMLII